MHDRSRPFVWAVALAWSLTALSARGGADGPVAAQYRGDEIWDHRIAAEPFDREPFRQVRIPAWVQDTVGVGYTLSVQNDEQRRRSVAAGVTISEVGFVDPLYVYYESRLLKRRNPGVPADMAARECAKYRELGVRILGVYPPSLQGEVWAAHPDWRRVATNTTTIPEVDLAKHPYGGMLCLLGPYGDYFVDVLAEIAEQFPVDAFSFDGLHYGGVCYCAHCREAFRRDTGQEIPDVNFDNPVFRRYQHWADRRMEDVIRRVQSRLKSIRSEIALVTWTTNAGRYGHFRDIPRNMPARMNLLLDAPDQEFWLDETNRGATIVPALANAYIWACTNHRVAFSEPYLMSHGNPYGKDSFPAHEVTRRMLLSVTHGTSPSIAVVQPAALQPAIEPAMAEIQRRRPWLTRKQPEPWGALLMSDNTRVFYGRNSGEVEDRYLAHVFGAFRAVVEEHLPVTMICDWNLTADELAPYKVVVLPNAACLSDIQVTALREYVRGGGGLVASVDASLCNEYGDPRADLALGDLFGITAAAGEVPTEIVNGVDQAAIDENFARALPTEYWRNRKNAFSLSLTADSPLASDRVRSLIGADPVMFKGPVAKVTLTGESTAEGPRVLATVRRFDDSQAPQQPAVVSRRVGKGRVIYFAAGVDHAYFSYAYPYQRMLLSNAMRWAAGSPPPLEVQAPLCVHATFFRQPAADGDRLLVHLYNDVNTSAFHALAQDDVPLREETLPIHDITLRLRGYCVESATQQPEGRLLDIVDDDTMARVTVPRLDIHSVIVLKLSADSKQQ